MTSISVGPSPGPSEVTSPRPGEASAASAGLVTVLIVDDRRLARGGAWASLGGLGDTRAIATAESVGAALQLAGDGTDVCLVSVAFGAGQGLSLAHRLKQEPGAAGIIVYDENLDSRWAGAAMIAGVDGAAALNDGPERLATVVDCVAAGHRAFPPLLPDPFAELAERVDEKDRRIVAMLLEGFPRDDIASVLGIGAHAFHTRRRAIVERLGNGLANDIRSETADTDRTPR